MPRVTCLNCPEYLSTAIRETGAGHAAAVVFAPVDYSMPPEGQAAAFKLPEGLFEQVVVLSHAAVSGLDYRHPQCIDEMRSDARPASDSISRFWRSWEDSARQAVGAEKLLILRLPFLAFERANDPLNLALAAGSIPRRPAFDCAFQVMSVPQLLGALRLSIGNRLRGTYNCAPRRVVCSTRLAGLKGVRSRFMLREGGGNLCGVENLSAGWWRLFRYPCTLDSSRFEEATGINWTDFPSAFPADAWGDPYGLDPDTVRHTAWHRVAARKFWRMSVTGQVDIPANGSAILIGPHRGFMPYDAVMMAYWMAVEHGRIPRYLVHHCLLRYPVLGQYIRRMGGLPACQENALQTLRAGEILAVFPEGIQGTFRYFRQTYTLGSFGRGDYIRWGLETGSPLLPYVCVGPAEAYPIFFKINWSWWKRNVEWPAFPITATFPFIPLPLPTKWHFHFLPTIHLQERFPGLKPDDEAGIRKASKLIRTELQEEILKLKSRRNNWFRGSLEPPP
jgi:1-acyl-sn-glycerol-3-phosphate acyltransferase